MLYLHKTVESVESYGKSPPPKFKKKFYYTVEDALRLPDKSLYFCSVWGKGIGVTGGGTYFFSITFVNI